MRRFSICIAILLLGLISVPAAGAQTNNGTAATSMYGLFRYSLELDRQIRTALVYIPPQYGPNRTLPVMLVFHPNGADAGLMAEITRMQLIGEQAGFITVYPDAGGQENVPGGRAWPVEADTTRDPAEIESDIRQNMVFIETLIKDLALQYHIDEQRIYAVGLGQGAAMAARLACQLADRLAAIALVSPGAPFTDCRPSSPVSVLVIQDKKARHRPLPTPGDQAPAPGRSESMVDWWLRFNQCAPEAAPTTKTADAECWTFRGCPRAGAVDFCQVDEAGQAWPGAGESITDNPYADLPFSASFTIWRFLDLHAKPLPTTEPPSNPPQDAAEDDQTDQIEQ